MNIKVQRPASFANPMAGESSLFLTIGFDPDTGRPSEVFYAEGFRSGSDLEFLVVDACIVISVALQSGIPAKDLSKSLSRRELPDGSFTHASILALILKTVEEVAEEFAEVKRD